MAGLSLANLNTVLATEANRIGPTIYRKTLNMSVWAKLVKQDVWPDEMGEVISVLTYQRSLPNAKLNWRRVRAASLVQDATDLTARQFPDAKTVEFSTKLHQYGLQHSAVESPMFDVTGLRFAFKRKEQLANIYNLLEEAVRYSWDERKRDEYIRIAERKIVVAPGLPESSIVPPAVGTDESGYVSNAEAFVQVAATSELTQSVLTKVRQQLLRSGARNNPLGMENAQPVFGLICSGETSERLISQNDKVRVDLNYAEPSELVKPLGVERSFKGYYHLIDDTMPRYNFTAGVYVEVPYYVKVNGIWEYNPAYENAAYESSIIFLQDAYTLLMPKPDTGEGKTKFDAVSFRGDFRFLNVPNVEKDSPYYNPDGTRGFYRGILASGTQPGRPEYAVVFIHQRSHQVIELIDVTSTNEGDSVWAKADDTADAGNIEGVDRKTAFDNRVFDTTNADATVTGGDTTGLAVGMSVRGAGIPAGTTILSITNGTTFELSANATATAADVTLHFGNSELGEI